MNRISRCVRRSRFTFRTFCRIKQYSNYLISYLDNTCMFLHEIVANVIYTLSKLTKKKSLTIKMFIFLQKAGPFFSFLDSKTQNLSLEVTLWGLISSSLYVNGNYFFGIYEQNSVLLWYKPLQWWQMTNIDSKKINKNRRHRFSNNILTFLFLNYLHHYFQLKQLIHLCLVQRTFVGIKMDTNCAHLLAALHLYSYEFILGL